MEPDDELGGCTEATQEELDALGEMPEGYGEQERDEELQS
jgi:hypothetical protein